MWKYFTKHQTGVYIGILPDLINKYNSTYNRAIKSSPTDARQSAKYQHVFESLYGGKNERIRKKLNPKFNVGDEVRIAKKKKTFEKGYTSNWTEEVFIIDKVQPTIPFTYKIRDGRGEDVKGTFYEQKLQKTHQNIFRIEKVLRRRINEKTGEREVYVKWKGYGNNFNQWITANDIEKR